jgi:Tfp pilus assembly protein PilF
MRMQKLLDEAAILRRNGSLGEAERRYRQALRLHPDNGTVLLLLGMLLAAQDRWKESGQVLRRAVNADPRDPDAHYNLGCVLQQLQRHEEALESYAKALDLDPGFAEAHNNGGNVLQALGRHEESLVHYDRAIAANPGYVVAYNNRGNALKAIARYGEAIASYRKALELDPQNAEARHFIALIRLSLGDYAQGWPELEWRWKIPGAAAPLRKLPQPLWLGREALRGKSILLYAEQGLGDTIQFARYAPLVAATGATVLLDVYAPLVVLMRTVPGVTRVLGPQDDAPITDFRCPLLSLPLAFGTTLDSIPPPVPYISLDAREASDWRAKLGGEGVKLVGLCWRGSPGYVNDAQRSIRFGDLGSLWRVPGVRFVSLQKAPHDEERAQMSALPQLVHPGADFPTTARMIAALDLVISVDTVWLTWAASIGRPAWALLNFAPHFTWLTQREDSPWYPGVRLLRQSAPGEWAGVVERAAGMLANASP